MTTDQIMEKGPMAQLARQVQPQIAAVRSAATDWEEQARTFVKQRPVVAVLSAAGMGYLVARLVSRGLR